MSAAGGPVALSSSGESAIKKQVDTSSDPVDAILTSDKDLRSQFDVASLVDWLKSGGWSRVALQLPDAYLRYSRALCAILNSEIVGLKPFVLADTSYGSCCVDVVTARHYSAQCVVHFGSACLSPPPNDLPVFYVVPKLPCPAGVQRQQLVDVVVGKLSNACGGAVVAAVNSVVILWQLAYAQWAEPVRDAVMQVWPEAHVEMADTIDPGTSTNVWDCPQLTIFIGDQSSASSEPVLPLWLMAQGTDVGRVLVFEPIHRSLTQLDRGGGVAKMLKKRLYLVERLRDSQRIGIVCGAVALADGQHKTAAQRLLQLCRAAGKAAHVFSVGKLNVEKLANFDMDVDAFVLISCPFGVLLEDKATKEHCRPICTLFEAEVALGGLPWFADAPWIAEIGATPKANEEMTAAVAESDVSLITNRIRHANKESQNESNRSWVGLTEEHSDSPNSLLPGKSGVAAAYEQEPMQS